MQKVPLSQDEFALFMQAWQKTARVDQVRSLLSLATRGKPIEDDVVGFARRLPAMRGYVITDPDALRLRVLVEHGEEMGLTGDDMRGILRDGATALGKVAGRHRARAGALHGRTIHRCRRGPRLT
ncbi:MAG: hypothetical protein WDN72_00035 [Alphaproteobacteria bacterium]